ncbi:MAG: DUF202 domain-containing protein [Dermatophilaceae bacterium]
MTGLRWHGRAGPAPAADVGLQTERTSIAWQRTALTLTAFSALVLHAANNERLGQAPGALGIAVALWMLLAADRRYAASVRRVGDGQSPVAPRMILAVTVAVVALASSAFALLLLARR